jgi:hypothetical protein
MLREFVPGLLWTSEMPFGRFGFDVGARTTVIRLADGDLVIHSPIALTPELRAAVDRVGPVRHLIAPSSMHYQHLAEWADAYPEARIYAVPGLMEKARALGDAEALSETPPAAWTAEMEQTLVRGSAIYDEAVFCHHPSRTLIVTDLCFNIPETSNASTRLWAKALGVLGGLSSSRSFPVTIRDRNAARATIERILEWEFERVILSHGEPEERNGKAEFRRAYSWLLRPR